MCGVNFSIKTVTLTFAIPTECAKIAIVTETKGLFKFIKGNNARSGGGGKQK